MLKKRLVACILIRKGWVVQSIGFQRYLPVGRPSVAVEFLNNWGIDEIVLLDISASLENRKPDFDLISKVAKNCFVPLTVGGGISCVEDIRMLLHCGADKVSINTVALQRPDFIKEASSIFGKQCIVVSIDAKKNDNGTFGIFNRLNGNGVELSSWVKRVEDAGAGEILLTSVDADGKKEGYGIDLINTVTGEVKIPVIACGGAGHPRHFLEGILLGNASAVAAGNFFHFTEHSPIIVKSYLISHGIDVRLDTYAHYDNVSFNDSGRITKFSDNYLEKLRFQYIPEEVI